MKEAAAQKAGLFERIGTTTTVNHLERRRRGTAATPPRLAADGGGFVSGENGCFKNVRTSLLLTSSPLSTGSVKKGMAAVDTRPAVDENIQANGFGGGATRSWGTAISAQSVSTSGSLGSPSSRSDPATGTAAHVGENGCLRLNHLERNGDEAGSHGSVVCRRKKKGQRAVGGDKSGRGLRQFSMKVCNKVESKGRTTYNEVADELVAEFSDPSIDGSCSDQYDEKNIRRRVYDALNVLMAMDIISKDKKDIQWKGLPNTNMNDIEDLKREHNELRSRIDKKAAYLQELEEQHAGLQNLIQRNEQLYGSENVPSGGVSLPFILVQTRPHATIEVEISEDMQLVHFDFNSTPFELHDDNYVLKAMDFGGVMRHSGNSDVAHEFFSEEGDGSCTVEPQAASQPLGLGAPSSPALPAILKARVRHEHC